jgi:hypothetical protein
MAAGRTSAATRQAATYQGTWRGAFTALSGKAEALYVVSDALIGANRTPIITLAPDALLISPVCFLRYSQKPPIIL